MSYKLKADSVSKISQQIGQQLLANAFVSDVKIDGERLISLTNSRQVNSFLIRSLFNQWKKEIEKLESPYFDFKHEKVKEALKDFMNVLSNHISIDRAHLEPLLVQAIADAFLIAFAPKLFLESVLNRSEKPQDFNKQFKYIKTNRDAFKQVVDAIGAFDTKASVLAAFDQVSADKFEDVDATEFMDKLNASALLVGAFEKIEPPKPAPVREPTPAPIQEAPKVAAPAPAATPTEAPKHEGPATLNDQFHKEGKSLTLAEKLQKSMKKSIEASLTLNEKFMFQNNLFGGDAAKMKAAFQAIDHASDLKDALAKANEYNNGWDMESEEVEALMAVLEKRFS